MTQIWPTTLGGDQDIGVISFRLFDIPVKVRPSFLVIAAILGWQTGDLTRVFAWIGIIFFSILIHELGHALTARGIGSTVEIELNAVGGLTSWTTPAEGFGPGRRALVAAAGSAVGVVFGGLVWLVVAVTGPYTGMTAFVLNTLIWVNLFWGLLNWLPVRPLDGGHLLTSLLEQIAPEKGERIANVIFFVTAAAAVAIGLWLRLIFVALLSGWLLWGEITRSRPRRGPVQIPPMSYDDVEDDRPVGERDQVD